MATAKKKTKAVTYYGTGRRKASVARVYVSNGTGKIIVNNRDISSYFPHETFVIDVKQPLTLTANTDKVDVVSFVKGGGMSGQAGAIRLGLARALMQLSGDYRPILKAARLVTVDSRVKERKKYGLKGARRAPQFSKR